MVPARSEIILEGRFIPGLREPEGPLGESTGYYIATNSPVAEIELVAMRNDAQWGHEAEFVKIDVPQLAQQKADTLLLQAGWRANQ